MTYKQRIIAHINDPDISRWIMWSYTSVSNYGKLQEFALYTTDAELKEFIDRTMIPALSCGKIVIVIPDYSIDGKMSCFIGNETSNEWKLNQLQQALDL